MSLDHDFLLLDAGRHSPSEYRRFLKHPDAVHLHDELLEYMTDSLRWIPTVNPAKNNEPGSGLNIYGPTAILLDGATIAARVFGGWAQLFRLGPSELVLTGSWCVIDGDVSSGHYEELRFQRDQIVDALEHIASDCRQIEATGGAYFLLHLGI